MKDSTAVRTPRRGRASLLRVLACASVLAGPLLARSLAPAACQDAEVSRALAEAREALGWQRVLDHPGVVRVRGAARTRGTDAQQTDVFDGRGRSFQSFVGPLPSSAGWDGETCWAVDWTGTPRVLELGDRLDALIASEFLYGGWVDSRCGLEFTAVARGRDEVALSFRHARGGLEGVVTLDGGTHLPRAIAWERAGQESVWTLGEHVDHDGYRFPARLSMLQSGMTQGLETGSVEFLADGGDSYYAPRLERPADTSFDLDVPAELEVMRARSGHLLVKALVDGSDLGWFVFDTGAGTNCISTSVAEALPEGPFGEILAKGVGGTVPARFWRANELRVGPLTLERPLFMDLELDFLSAAFGVEVAGILGYELISRCVVEFDQRTPTIRLFDPELYELGDEDGWQELLLYARHPNVHASFEGRSGVFKIDTGAARDTVTFHAPIVRELGLLEGRSTVEAGAGGVGGQVPVRVGEIESFTLGGHPFGPIQAQFATSDEGAFGDPFVWGNLGGRLFDPFLMVFDYANRRMSFLPRN